MKVIAVYLIGRPSNGGSYQYWMAVLKALTQINQDKYQVIVYSPYEDWGIIVEALGLTFSVVNNNLNFVQKVCIYGFSRFIPLGLQRKFAFLWNPFVNTLRKKKPDLWIAQTTEIGEKLLGIPTIVPIFDLMHRYHPEIPELNEKFKEREILYTYECKHATRILVDSEVGKQHVLECYGDGTSELGNKIRILPFIPSDYIYEAEDIEELPYSIFSKYIFYPAQFWTHKNHTSLLQAIQKLKEKGIIINLVLVGSEQNNEQTVENMIEQYGIQNQVKILGYVNNLEMVYLYKHARALVMPTLLGPTNIPQLEAFVLHCPVATSRIYAIPEQVGDAALLFDPLNVEEIAHCIERLWVDDELCQELINKGQKKAEAWGQQEFADTLLKYIYEI